MRNIFLFLDKIKDNAIFKELNKEISSLYTTIYLITDIKSDNYEILLQKLKINSCKIKKIEEITCFKENENIKAMMKREKIQEVTVVDDKGFKNIDMFLNIFEKALARKKHPLANKTVAQKEKPTQFKGWYSEPDTGEIFTKTHQYFTVGKNSNKVSITPSID